MCITHSHDFSFEKFTEPSEFMSHPSSSITGARNSIDFIAEPLIVHNIGDIEKRVEEALETAELTPPREFFYRFPHELSGGQRQRVAIARAMILNPEFIVADEPVSMLDVSIRTSILNLMMRLRDELDISYLYITHDLATAKHICDRIGIMYLGKIVEEAEVEELIDNALHPYTQALIAAVPDPDPSVEKSKAIIKGEAPNPKYMPSGCRFHNRCSQNAGDQHKRGVNTQGEEWPVISLKIFNITSLDI